MKQLLMPWSLILSENHGDHVRVSAMLVNPLGLVRAVKEKAIRICDNKIKTLSKNIYLEREREREREVGLVRHASSQSSKILQRLREKKMDNARKSEKKKIEYTWNEKIYILLLILI